MNPFNSNLETVQQQQISQLTDIGYVFHAWLPLSVIGNDGAILGLDTRFWNPAEPFGSTHLPRLRLVPINAIQRPVIDNKQGFAAVNMFVGEQGADGQPKGFGSGMAGATKTNVKPEWIYPHQLLSDLVFTFNRWGLIALNNLRAQSAEEFERHQLIFDIVMSGLPKNTLLEDIPEYFGGVSAYLPLKRAAHFERTPFGQIEKAAAGGVQIYGADAKPAQISDREKIIAEQMVEQFAAAVAQSHTAALDAEMDGVLAKTREGRQNGQKTSYDKCDQWLMKEFPSFPMDTELEKSNAQILKALSVGSEQDSAPQQSGVPVELYLEEKKRNDKLAEDVAFLKGQFAAAAPVEQPKPAAARK